MEMRMRLSREHLSGACGEGLELFESLAQSGAVSIDSQAEYESFLQVTPEEFRDWLGPIASGSGYGSGYGYGDGYGYGEGYGDGSGYGSQLLSA